MFKQKQLERAQIKYNIWLVLFWSLAFISGFTLVVGFFMFTQGDGAGLLTFLISTAVFVTILILFLKARKKYLPVIHNLFIEIIKDGVSTCRGENKFITNTANSLSFTSDGILIDGVLYSNNNIIATYNYEVYSSAILDRIVFTLFIYVNVNNATTNNALPYCVKIDGDLLNALQKYNVKVINDKDWNYFLNNLEVEAPKILKKAIWNTSYAYAPISCENAYAQSGDNLNV